jgi:hypothetical protein
MLILLSIATYFLLCLSELLNKIVDKEAADKEDGHSCYCNFCKNDEDLSDVVQFAPPFTESIPVNGQNCNTRFR